MADNYTHQYSARNALQMVAYEPRDIDAFIMGANGPDPLFCYQMYNPFRKLNLSALGSLMHKEKTGMFLKNLFELARTDAQKDYCLGFLCHYSMDSTLHPFVEYVDSAYSSPFNIPSGHGYFESALDSRLSLKVTGNPAPSVDSYCPKMNPLTLNQITYLFKRAVDATYPGYSYTQDDYIQAFKDFRLVKDFFYSPGKFKHVLAGIVEKALKFSEGYVKSHMQPCTMDIPDYPFWINEGIGFYSCESLDEILKRADYLSAEQIGFGIQYFAGQFTLKDLMKEVGNKSYETGIAIPDYIFEEKGRNMIYSIALDGPGGAGKSTVAKRVAARKGIIYVDTGAMYRRIALFMLRNDVDVSDIKAVEPLLSQVDIRIKFEDGTQKIFLNGEDVSTRIRENRVSLAASTVSRHKEVRSFLLETQRNLARHNSVIMDGRDIGTVVLPDAQVKIYLTADVEERARRRFKELTEKGQDVNYDDILAEIKQRDYQDMNREVAPLRQAEDAVLLDTTDLGFEESVEKVMEIIREKTGA
jgi:cytidylate kinase